MKSHLFRLSPEKAHEADKADKADKAGEVHEESQTASVDHVCMTYNSPDNLPMLPDGFVIEQDGTVRLKNAQFNAGAGLRFTGERKSVQIGPSEFVSIPVNNLYERMKYQPCPVIGGTNGSEYLLEIPSMAVKPLSPLAIDERAWRCPWTNKSIYWVHGYRDVWLQIWAQNEEKHKQICDSHRDGVINLTEEQAFKLQLSEDFVNRCPGACLGTWYFVDETGVLWREATHFALVENKRKDKGFQPLLQQNMATGETLIVETPNHTDVLGTNGLQKEWSKDDRRVYCPDHPIQNLIGLDPYMTWDEAEHYYESLGLKRGKHFHRDSLGVHLTVDGQYRLMDEGKIPKSKAYNYYRSKYGGGDVTQQGIDNLTYQYRPH